MINRIFAIVICLCLLPDAVLAQGYNGLFAPQKGYKAPEKKKEEIPDKTTPAQQQVTGKTIAPLPAPHPAQTLKINNDYLAPALQGIDTAYQKRKEEINLQKMALQQKQKEQLDKIIAENKLRK